MELYLHIPFCARKCEYCSFVSFLPSAQQKDEYIRLLLLEGRLRKKEFTEPVHTVYVGGGTPSLLSAEQLRYLFGGLEDLISFDNCIETTIEANPGTLKKDFVLAAAEAGVNRISFGMQAYQETILKRLGRIHSFPDVIESVQLARHYGIDNINLDLIFGIPGQTLDDWKATLDAALSLEPLHISAYGLIPEEGTPLYERLVKGEQVLPDQETERDMYDLALEELDKKGYRQYEISNFAKEGFECLHNIGYWSQVPYIGLGVSAASMLITKQSEDGLWCTRRNNPETIRDYEQMVSRDTPDTYITEKITPREARFETMMLTLRMNRGIDDLRFEKMHGISIESCYGTKMEELQRKGLIKHEGGSWFLTRRGMDIQNSILVELMEQD